MFERKAPKGVLLLDALVVTDGNVLQQGEQPAALQARRTWVGAIRIRCVVAKRTCTTGSWFLTLVPAGSFTYDPVAGTARVRAKVSKRETVDVRFAVTGDRPGVLRPAAGQTPSGSRLVVTGGAGVTRAATATGTVFGLAGKGGGSLITGLAFNVYLDPPVGPRLDLARLLP